MRYKIDEIALNPTISDYQGFNINLPSNILGGLGMIVDNKYCYDGKWVIKEIDEDEQYYIILNNHEQYNHDDIKTISIKVMETLCGLPDPSAGVDYNVLLFEYFFNAINLTLRSIKEENYNV